MLKIASHPMNLHLRLASLWPDFLTEVPVEFFEFPEGRDTAQFLEEGKIYAGGTGSTPPLIAQSAGKPVIYLAASAPRPGNGALLVAPDSPIKEIADLKGKRVAMIDGSFHTYLLARSLDQAGLTLNDVVRVEMSPAASRKALAEGEVDVWIAMAPLIEQTIAARETRLLALCGATIPNRSMFWTLQGAGASDAELSAFVRALVRLGEAVTAEPEKAAALLAGPDASPELLAQWRGVIAGRDWTVVPASEAIIAEQQQEADVLHAHGDFPAPLKISAFLPLTAA